MVFTPYPLPLTAGGWWWLVVVGGYRLQVYRLPLADHYPFTWLGLAGATLAQNGSEGRPGVWEE